MACYVNYVLRFSLYANLQAWRVLISNCNTVFSTEFPRHLRRSYYRELFPASLQNRSEVLGIKRRFLANVCNFFANLACVVWCNGDAYLVICADAGRICGLVFGEMTNDAVFTAPVMQIYSHFNCCSMVGKYRLVLLIRSTMRYLYSSMNFENKISHLGVYSSLSFLTRYIFHFLTFLPQRCARTKRKLDFTSSLNWTHVTNH